MMRLVKKFPLKLEDTEHTPFTHTHNLPHRTHIIGTIQHSSSFPLPSLLSFLSLDVPLTLSTHTLIYFQLWISCFLPHPKKINYETKLNDILYYTATFIFPHPPLDYQAHGTRHRLTPGSSLFFFFYHFVELKKTTVCETHLARWG